MAHRDTAVELVPSCFARGGAAVYDTKTKEGFFPGGVLQITVILRLN